MRTMLTGVVTGASSGIGLETARGMAAAGMRVLLLGRDLRRLGAARDDIRRTSGSRALEVYVADLASQDSIRQVAQQLTTQYSRLDVLVNNAAVITRTRSLTGDGIEAQFAVNHLAPFLLSHLLLDRLSAAGRARIVNVASDVESDGEIAFDDLNGDRDYDPAKAYRQSKLANVLFTYELARRVEARGITANCLHPGVVATKLLNDYSGRPSLFRLVDRLRYLTAGSGASTSLYLAVSPEVEGVTGCYFRDSRIASSSSASHDRSLQIRLWDVSCRLTHSGDV